MNFLLHRQFATSELDCPTAGVGAMLPDLWRMADRRMRARPAVQASPQTQPLQAGVDHHLEADAWFHRTPVFVDGERVLARQLAAVKVPKLVLLAHAAWEICLDGALLLAHDFDEALEGLRNDFETARETLDDVADLHGAAELVDQERFSGRMLRLREGLLEGRWIASYQTGDGLAQCIGGIRRRFALPTWTEDEEAVTACILEEALERATDVLPRLFAARTAHLAEATS
jgi:hypothetical protein